MAIENENGNGFFMPVAPAYGNGGNGFGFGGDWGWIVLLLLLAGNGGWGFGGGFGGFGGGYEFPWLMNGQANINTNTTSGFRDAMLNDGITSIRDGIGGIGTQLCGGFAGVTAAVTGAQNSIAQQMYTNQIAELERSFAAQTASTQGMTDIRSQLAQCCCDNRLATNDLKATLASEACATRAANTANTQMILDKLCALEIDGLKERNATLLADNNALKFAASQTAQNGFIQRTVADAIQYVHPAPIPAYIVANPNVTPTTAA